MQASKIIPGKTYAVRRGEALLRFRVREVNTITQRKQANRSPHDSRSEIVGYFVDRADNGGPVEPATLAPDDIQGEYTQFAELVERAAKEKAEREAKEKAERKQAQADRLALYAFVGLEPPQKADEYGQPFYLPSYGNVQVREDGVRLLVDKIRELTSTTTQHSPALLAAAKAQWDRERKEREGK